MSGRLADIYNSFKEDGDNGGGDKNTIHTYIDLYESYLSPKLSEPIDLLEIGVFKGHSMALWCEYLPKGSLITGVDIINRIDPKFLSYQFEFLHGDILNQNILNKVKERKYDVIIDDGSHELKDQVAAFSNLKDCLNEGGLYFIEDIPNIDRDYPTFKELGFAIYDMRRVKNRFDDILAVYIG